MTNNNIGDNSGTSGDVILGYIKRIEKLEEEKKIIAEDIKDIFAEVKARGFDSKTIRALIKERKKSEQQRKEQFELFELYSAAIGME